MTECLQSCHQFFHCYEELLAVSSESQFSVWVLKFWFITLYTIIKIIILKFRNSYWDLLSCVNNNCFKGKSLKQLLPVSITTTTKKWIDNTLYQVCSYFFIYSQDKEEVPQTAIYTLKHLRKKLSSFL